MFIPVEALIWIRSIAIVLLIVAHALRHVQREGTEGKHAAGPTSPSVPLVVTPELLDAFRSLLAQTTISEEVNPPPVLPWPKDEQGNDVAQEGKLNAKCEQGVKNKVTGESDDGPETNNYERVKAYLAGHPNAKVRDVAKALVISVSTANKWMIRIKGKRLQGERHA